MHMRRFAALTAALTATASLFGGTAVAATATGAAHARATVRPDTFIGRDDGYGATLDAAIRAAEAQMGGDYYGCKPPFYVIDDAQLADGTWWAEVAENGCVGYY